jgi:hypothetical protein
MRQKVILCFLGVWLLVCILWGMRIVARYLVSDLSLGSELLPVVIGSMTFIWISVLTAVFLRHLPDVFSVRTLKPLAALWFVLVLVLHFSYIQKTIAFDLSNVMYIARSMPAHLLSFLIVLVSAIPFVLLTLIAKEGH